MLLKGNKALRYFKISCLKPWMLHKLHKHLKSYLDLAMATKIKSILSNNEIMDLMEELEEIISRVYRQKRRQLEGQNPPVSTATAPIQPAVAGTSTENNYFGGPSPQGPMAVPLQQYHNDPQYYQF